MRLKLQILSNNNIGVWKLESWYKKNTLTSSIGLFSYIRFWLKNIALIVRRYLALSQKHFFLQYKLDTWRNDYHWHYKCNFFQSDTMYEKDHHGWRHLCNSTLHFNILCTKKTKFLRCYGKFEILENINILKVAWGNWKH